MDFRRGLGLRLLGFARYAESSLDRQPVGAIQPVLLQALHIFLFAELQPRSKK